MEKGYKNVVYLFLAITVIILFGFYKTYFELFPDFTGIKTIHHIHGLTLVLWLAMLIVQPILINNKKYKLHRTIGKFSYVLVPLIFIFMLLVYKNQYLKGEANGDPHVQNLGILFIPLTDTLPFVIFYILAIFNKKNISKHLRYMISTAIIVVGPGLGRIFLIWLGMDFITAITAVSVVLFFAFLGLILYDKIKGKQFKINPFAISLLIFLIPNILILFVPNTSLWQTFADGIVKTFF